MKHNRRPYWGLLLSLVLVASSLLWGGNVAAQGPDGTPTPECEQCGDVLIAPHGEVQAAADKVSAQALTEPATEIDLLWGYTPMAASFVGGEEELRRLAYAQLADANLSYWNSDVTPRDALLGLVEVPFHFFK
jgi:hypothetical protein